MAALCRICVRGTWGSRSLGPCDDLDLLLSMDSGSAVRKTGVGTYIFGQRHDGVLPVVDRDRLATETQRSHVGGKPAAVGAGRCLSPSRHPTTGGACCCGG